MNALAELPPDVSVRSACEALGVSRATLYRAWARDRIENAPVAPAGRRPIPSPPRRLHDAERAAVIALLHSDEFADQPPREIVAALLSQGLYVCSVRTMYRILGCLGESHERRAQRGHATYEAPFVRATAPNEVWVWDITALPGPRKGEVYFLYAVMDLYSRFVVAWQVAYAQSGDLAERLFVDACATWDIAPASLCVHSDRGAPMTSYRLTQMFDLLGVAPSYSRPRVSDDNPHIESQFKTLKYQPDFPGRFESYRATCTWCESYYAWYNFDHHHAGIALYTPANLFFGDVDAVLATRQAALDQAYSANPERFVNGRPVAARPPAATEINPADLIAPEQLDSAAPSQLSHVRRPNGQGRFPRPQLVLPIST
jgi:transposase InsO family protein